MKFQFNYQWINYSFDYCLITELQYWIDYWSKYQLIDYQFEYWLINYWLDY